MKKHFIEKKENENIFVKYKKWIITVIGIQVIPTLLVLITIIGMMVYNYVGSDIRWHPYQKYIYGGYNIGLEEGMKDRNNMLDRPFGNKTFSYIEKTPWDIYKKETELIKERIMHEKDEYLAQFPENERSNKRADMRLENIQTPSEKILEERHLKAEDFYTHYVDQRIRRASYKNDEEYNKALEEDAWKLGFEYGYARGRAGDYEPGSLW